MEVEDWQKMEMLGSVHRVSDVSGEEFKPIQLDDELIQDLLNRLWALFPYIHFAST